MTSEQSAAAGREGATRVSVAQFLIAELAMLAIVPFIDQVAYGRLIESVLITAVLLMAMFAIGGNRTTLMIAAILLAPAAVGQWIDHFWPGVMPILFTNVTSLVYVAFVLFHLGRFILRAPRVNNEVLCAGVATYVMVGVFWTFAYLAAARLSPESFVIDDTASRPLHGYEALFLSFGTLSNVGYDEIELVSKPAQMLAMAEAMTSMFYMTMFIARLVALYSDDRSILPKGD
ncbi:MAG TPA: ion channel [Pirellulales bacterium]|nr:ion channel [Pirellulales bacterium]